MNKSNHYPLVKPNDKKMNEKQFNEVIRFLKIRKCRVKGTNLDDYSNMITTYASVLWEIDQHYEKLRSRGNHFSDDAKQFLYFNTPKSHGHAVKKIDTIILNHKISELVIHLERKYMYLQHMKPIKNVVESVCIAITEYLEYLETQCKRNTLYQKMKIPQLKCL